MGHTRLRNRLLFSASVGRKRTVHFARQKTAFQCVLKLQVRRRMKPMRQYRNYNVIVSLLLPLTVS